jgi:hypothetical protein
MNARQLRPLLRERSQREGLTIVLVRDIALADGAEAPAADDCLAVVVRGPDLPREQQYAFQIFQPDADAEAQLDRLVATWREANAA